MKYLLIAFLYCLSNYAFSQQIAYTKFDMEDGIVGQQVMALYEDKKGNIWIGTKQGICVYDGAKFTKIEGEALRITIQHIFESEGTIWATYSQGLFKIQNNKIIATYNIDKNMTFDNSHLPYLNSKNNIVIQCRWKDYSLSFDIKTEKYSEIKHSSYQKGNLKGTKFSTGWMRESLHVPQKVDEINGHIFNKDHKEILQKKYSGTPFEHRLDTANYLFYPQFPIKNEWFQYITLHTYWNDNHILLASDPRKEKKLLYHDLERGLEKYYDLGFIKAQINSIILDKHKNIWIGAEDGLYKIFAEYINYYDQKNGLPTLPWSLQQDDEGNYVVGSYETKRYYKLLKDSSIFFPITTKSMPITRTYYGATKTNKNEIVFNTDYGAYLYKKNEFVLLNDTIKTSRNVEGAWRTFFIAHVDTLTDEIALGGQSRFIVYDKDRNIKNVLLKKDLMEKGGDMTVFRENILSIEKIDTNTYFLGLNKGYLFYDTKKSKIIDHYFYKDSLTNPADSSRNYKIISMKKDKYGSVWCGVRSNEQIGLCRYDIKTNTFEQVANELLGEGIVETIQTTANGEILLVSNNRFMMAIHLPRFYSKNGNYQYILNKKNGFPAKEPAQNSMMEDDKGKIWVLTGDSKLYNFTIDTTIFNLPKHEVSTGQIDFFDKGSFTWQPINKSLSDTLVFDKEVRSLRFRMNAITQNAPENLVYVFRFKKGNSEWSEWKETDAYFALPDFPAGTSQLQVACYYFFDSEKLEGKPIKTFCLLFEPFWYEKSWVQVLGVLIFLSLIGTALIFYIKNKQKGILVRQNLSIISAKNQTIEWLKNSLEHDLKNDLSAMRDVAEVNISKLKSKEDFNDAENKQSRLLATVNYYAFMLQKAGDNKNVKELLSYLVINLLEKYGRGDIKVIPKSNLDVEDKLDRYTTHKIIHCIVELVRNTLKYAFPADFSEKFNRKPTIRLEVIKENEQFFIRYQDNGIGLQNTNSNQERTGEGFELLKEYSFTDSFIWKNREEGGVFIQLRLRIDKSKG